MCGLVAVMALNGAPADGATVERMSETLIHRGPNDSGTFLSGSVGMGFRRLSILDLSPSGHQPMLSADGNLALVFNGEIYNYIELRDELIQLGHEFRSSGDSEVLLHAYQEWGSDCLGRLNGMWAFLIYDIPRRVLFGARDRFGVKPLFRYNNGEAVLFASEIKAIRASGHYRSGEPNWDVATQFLVLGELDETCATFYPGIEQIPPGGAFEERPDGQRREWRYFSLGDLPGQAVANPVEAFGALFHDSVRLRLRSDVPVGVCLSGGLDSTSIICTMAELMKADGGGEALHAFCYMDREFDETPYVEDTLRQTGAVLNRLETSPAVLWQKLNEMLHFHDEPFHTMTVMVGYELMRLAASKGIVVVLNGQGADETAAGYGSYFRVYWQNLLRSGRLVRALREIAGHSRGHGTGFAAQAVQELSTMLRSILRISGIYREMARRKHVREAGALGWYSGDLMGRLDIDESRNDYHSLNETLRTAVEVEPLPLYLRIEDRNSMAHSIESRLPFMDYRLISLLFSLPDSCKLSGPLNKFVLRESMRGRIPESVRTRIDKLGFPVPQRRWFGDALMEPVQDLLSSRRLRERGIYNIDRISADLKAHGRGERNVHFELFRLLQFEIWNEMNEAPAGKVALSA